MIDNNNDDNVISELINVFYIRFKHWDLVCKKACRRLSIYYEMPIVDLPKLTGLL